MTYAATAILTLAALLLLTPVIVMVRDILERLNS